MPRDSQPNQVGPRLEALREAAGLSRAELCRAIPGLNQSAYSQYELGKRACPEWIKIKIAEYYGATLDFVTLGKGSQLEIDLLFERLRARRRRDQ